jgi:aminoglycoside phosphotransferase (APT) family kinase protein
MAADCDRAVVSWAVQTLSPGADVIEVRDLHDGFGPWLVRCADPSDSAVHAGVVRVGAAWPGKLDGYVLTEAAAMRLAERAEGVAPRLLGLDADRRATGRVASVVSVLDGEPIGAGPCSPARLRSFGAQLAHLHQLTITSPTAELPIRRHAMHPGGPKDFWEGGFTDERRRYAGTPRAAAGEALFARVDAVLARQPRPQDSVSLIHGDAWVGNANAVRDRCVGFFDWGCAGVGEPGVDVGYARQSAALTYGLPAADDVLTGWEATTGGRLSSIVYWDVVAARLTPPDMGPVTDIRDELLLRALGELESQ